MHRPGNRGVSSVIRGLNPLDRRPLSRAVRAIISLQPRFYSWTRAARRIALVCLAAVLLLQALAGCGKIRQSLEIVKWRYSFLGGIAVGACVWYATD